MNAFRRSEASEASYFQLEYFLTVRYSYFPIL